MALLKLLRSVLRAVPAFGESIGYLIDVYLSLLITPDRVSRVDYLHAFQIFFADVSSGFIQILACPDQ